MEDSGSHSRAAGELEDSETDTGVVKERIRGASGVPSVISLSVILKPVSY